MKEDFSRTYVYVWIRYVERATQVQQNTRERTMHVDQKLKSRHIFPYIYTYYTYTYIMYTPRISYDTATKQTRMAEWRMVDLVLALWWWWLYSVYLIYHRPGVYILPENQYVWELSTALRNTNTGTATAQQQCSRVVPAPYNIVLISIVEAKGYKLSATFATTRVHMHT